MDLTSGARDLTAGLGPIEAEPGFLGDDGAVLEPDRFGAFATSLATTSPALAAELQDAAGPVGADGMLSGPLLRDLARRLADFFSGRTTTLIDEERGWLEIERHIVQCPPGDGNSLTFSCRETRERERRYQVQVPGFGGGPSLKFSLEMNDSFPLGAGQTAQLSYQVACTWQRWRVEGGSSAHTFVRLGSIDNSARSAPLTEIHEDVRSAWGAPDEDVRIETEAVTPYRDVDLVIGETRLRKLSVGAAAFGQRLAVDVLTSRRFTVGRRYRLASGTRFVAERFDDPATWWVRPM